MADSLVDMLDETLRQELALPGLRDLFPSPGDVAKSLFGGKTLETLGKQAGQQIKSAVGQIPKPPSL